MHDDRIGRQVGKARAVERAALEAFARIGGRRLIRRLGEAEALQADGDARGVHHREHLLQPGVGRADQLGRGAVEVEDARRRGLDAHLLFERPAGDGVARAERAVLADGELRHEEKADAARARGRIGQAREHEVDDVLGEVVLARGDEDLGPRDGVGALARGLGARADEPEVGAALRLGEAHRARPRPLGEARQEPPLLRLAAVERERVVSGEREARVGPEAQVGRADEFLEDDLQHLRQTLAAVGAIAREARPAARGEGAVGLPEALRGANGAVFEPTAVGVARRVERQQLVLAEARGFLENGVDDVGGRLLTARQCGDGALVVEQLVKDEAHVVERGAVADHRRGLSCAAACRSRACAPCARASPRS